MCLIKIELTENELHLILNILTVKSLSGNLDEEDKVLGKKISKASTQIKSKKNVNI